MVVVVVEEEEVQFSSSKMSSSMNNFTSDMLLRWTVSLNMEISRSSPEPCTHTYCKSSPDMSFHHMSVSLASSSMRFLPVSL